MGGIETFSSLLPIVYTVLFVELINIVPRLMESVDYVVLMQNFKKVVSDLTCYALRN